jgi:hypothetical protein
MHLCVCVCVCGALTDTHTHIHACMHACTETCVCVCVFVSASVSRAWNDKSWRSSCHIATFTSTVVLLALAYNKHTIGILG